ncbi:hypothetical protein HSB1_42920 [Halogranum salarium B-1]|uniref:Uncharacterized protein n=1 Tax=Halogranum salarium B-1 TaxID=1210908 RepID=J3JDA8_9EURY|nr:hypothetical protein HSB1_42920 [Halogranum salarium B-1]
MIPNDRRFSRRSLTLRECPVLTERLLSGKPASIQRITILPENESSTPIQNY